MPLTFFIEALAVRHPKGMESFSPGLRGTSYPGCPLQPCQGLYQLLSMNRHAPIYGVEERQDERAATLSGLMGLLSVSPRVARCSQPWAERCNPFGIERRVPAPQNLVTLGFQTCCIASFPTRRPLDVRRGAEPRRPGTRRYGRFRNLRYLRYHPAW